MAGIELCKFTHGRGLYILRFYPSLSLGVKIKAQPMCKFAQLYACHELFLNYLAFQTFDIEPIYWRLLQKRVVHTNFNIYVVILIIIIINIVNIITITLMKIDWCFGLVMLFNATFYNISAILWRLLLLVAETGLLGENHRPAASDWQTLLHRVHLAKNGVWTHNVSEDRDWLH